LMKDHDSPSVRFAGLRFQMLVAHFTENKSITWPSHML